MPIVFEMDSVSPINNDDILKIRYLINDLDSTAYKYSDTRLSQLYIIAACYVKTDIQADFIVNITELTITPTQAEDVKNLITLKAACLLVQSEYKSAAQSAIRFTDGPSTADYKGVADSVKESAYNFCKDYARGVMYYLSGQSNNITLISTPNNG